MNILITYNHTKYSLEEGFNILSYYFCGFEHSDKAIIENLNKWFSFEYYGYNAELIHIKIVDEYKHEITLKLDSGKIYSMIVGKPWKPDYKNFVYNNRYILICTWIISIFANLFIVGFSPLYLFQVMLGTSTGLFIGTTFAYLIKKYFIKSK